MHVNLRYPEVMDETNLNNDIPPYKINLVLKNIFINFLHILLLENLALFDVKLLIMIWILLYKYLLNTHES
jgi:hypothetical protein